MSEEPEHINGEDEPDSTLLQLHPAWREAVKRIVEAEHPWGYVLTFEELYGLLDVEMPGPETPLADAQRSELQFLGQFKRMEKALLHEHQLALKNVIGEGYMLLPPKEQSEWAYTECLKELRRAVGKGIPRAIHIRLHELTDAERAQAADRVATLANLAHLMSSRGLKAAQDRKALTGDPA